MLLKNNNSITLKQKVNITYQINFLENIFWFRENNPLYKLCKDKQLFIVVDSEVYKIYYHLIDSFFEKCSSNFVVHEIIATEKTKTIGCVTEICKHAKKFELKRNAFFVGIGGGITTDIVGFAAFMYRRKIPYIRIPTTLVGLIDAGIGVKVGVNFAESKNLLGGYYPPTAVFNDQTFLKTLSREDLRCGLFEMVKMGVVKSSLLFTLIEKHYQTFINKNFNGETNRIHRTASFLMLKELEQNLYESNLERLVDFGHTFSPFFETSTVFQISHGEAVGLDILTSSFLSYSRGLLSSQDFHRICNLISGIGFSNKYTFLPAEELHKSLSDIRNHRSGNLNLVLPKKIGSAIFTNSCTLQEVEDAINFVNSFSTESVKIK